MMTCRRPDRGATACFFSRSLVFIFIFFFSLSSLLPPSVALVHLRSKPFSFTFLDAPARFAVPVDGAGICGSLHVADPLDACSILRNNSTAVGDGAARGDERFVLISRGICSFEDKVRNAQDGGFEAAIIYDDQEKSSLYSMVGDSAGIHIHAVFVSKMAGETLKKFARGEEGECCIGSSMDETAGTILVISFVSLVVIIVVLAAFMLARNCQLLRQQSHNQPSSMKREAVELIPCFTFRTAYLNNKRTSETCAICLEDYKDGESLRVLPCQHDFHLVCVDSWLTKWGTFCPICKHDMRQ
ncbi:hypothetical protein Cni_G14641 [Canna indica]|uniref:RING-type domain-containing protein n=1 Tax=Canna indica TaxID=4628 RepID=A0AAQ3QEY4_9LILI|nr:hypothetical protein Cni_G14641 [Canna indica]